MFENYQKINIEIDRFDVSFLTFAEIFAIIKENYQFSNI